MAVPVPGLLYPLLTARGRNSLRRCGRWALPLSGGGVVCSMGAGPQCGFAGVDGGRVGSRCRKRKWRLTGGGTGAIAIMVGRGAFRVPDR